jgi:opacity protein-like surface antigen
MKKIVLASVAATALIAALAPAKAEEPGEEQLLSQRGALQGNQMGSAAYGSAPWTSSEFGLSAGQFPANERAGLMGYAPSDDFDYDE